MMSTVSMLPRHATRTWTFRSSSAGREGSGCTSCDACSTASNTITRTSNGEAGYGFARAWGNDRSRQRGAEGDSGMLTIEAKRADLLVLAGRLDASQCGPAQAALDAAHGVVTLDCSGLEYISSAGLGVL